MHAVEAGRARRWPAGAGAPPYFWGTWREGTATALGDSACHLGHRHAGRDARPRGVFASWSWDGEALTAEVDPLGYFNLFVFTRGTTVGVSPSLLQLIAAGADTAIDDRALGVFYRLGMFLHQDTPFAHIRVLPPGGKLRWSKGALAISGAPFASRERTITRDDAVDAFISLTRQSMADILRAWPGEVVLPLSGGRDSRHILLEMDRVRRPPRACVTFHHEGPRLNAEAKAARAICERVGVPHIVLGHPRSRAKDILRTLVLTSLCSDEHAQMMPLHDFFTGQAAAALDGIAGDILSNPDMWAEEFFQRAQRGDFRGIAMRMMEGHARVVSSPGWAGGAGPIYSKGRDEEAVEYVAAAIAQLAEAPDPYQSFWFWHRTRREISFVTTSMLATAQAVFCPYLDPDLVELGLSLPYRVTRDQKIHDDAITRAYPASLGVPFQESFASPRPRWGRYRQKLRSTLDGITMLLAVRPDRPVSEWLKGAGRLRRPSRDTYRMYASCIEELDAEKATRLLELAAELHAARPRDLITDRLDPVAQATDNQEAA